MSPKIFLTGATGYIGGDALYALYAAHPEYEYTLFVRDNAQAESVKKSFPAAAAFRYVYGDLNTSIDAIEAAAAAADVVVHMGASADNLAAAQAIIDGGARGHTAEHPGVFIHVSGTGNLMAFSDKKQHDLDNQRFGQPPVESETFNDYEGVERLVTGIPEHAPHRNVDMVVQAGSRAHDAVLRTAIVSPPTIYGRGRGPGNQRGLQVYDLATYTLKKGFAPVVEGSGETRWDHIHIYDLSKLMVRLVEAGLKPAERDAAGRSTAPGSIFGLYGFYHVAQSTHRWSEVAAWLAQEAQKQGALPKAEVRQVPLTAVAGPDAPGNGPTNATWGLNSSGEAVRAARLLGWKPTERSLQAEIPDVVAAEVKRLKA